MDSCLLLPFAFNAMCVGLVCQRLFNVCRSLISCFLFQRLLIPFRLLFLPMPLVEMQIINASL